MRNKLVKRKQARKARVKDVIIFGGEISIPAALTALNIGFDYHLASCQSTIGISRNHLNITDSFQLYRYKTLQMEWIPRIGPNSVDAGAVVKCQYSTSPEDINYITQTATATNAENFIKATEDYKVFNAWERFTWNVPLNRLNRLPWYSVDTTFTPSVDGYERNTQGVVVVTYQNTTTAAVVLGEFRFTYVLELRGLSSTPGT